ncbi:hypothetical protein P8452_32352 [Trifolium repens]|nr:hypothetical protein P8452_32352 [Trifolium repens]
MNKPGNEKQKVCRRQTPLAISTKGGSTKEQGKGSREEEEEDMDDCCAVCIVAVSVRPNAISSLLPRFGRF